MLASFVATTIQSEEKTPMKTDKKLALIKEIVRTNVQNPTICCKTTRVVTGPGN
jgi:hypothetical protein